jgi:N-methylhydantoinase B/oxoprolinase/acetone carboxylase alpha subunit
METATDAGWGDLMKRPVELAQENLKNGYITLEQANEYHGLDKRK